MSRTRKGAKGAGYDYGSRYECDKHYSGGVGKFPKQLAASERRNTSKSIVRKDLSAVE